MLKPTFSIFGVKVVLDSLEHELMTRTILLRIREYVLVKKKIVLFFFFSNATFACIVVFPIHLFTCLLMQ